MTVGELIMQLAMVPRDAQVMIMMDGGNRPDYLLESDGVDILDERDEPVLDIGAVKVVLY